VCGERRAINVADSVLKLKMHSQRREEDELWMFYIPVAYPLNLTLHKNRLRLTT